MKRTEAVFNCLTKLRTDYNDKTTFNDTVMNTWQDWAAERAEWWKEGRIPEQPACSLPLPFSQRIPANYQPLDEGGSSDVLALAKNSSLLAGNSNSYRIVYDSGEHGSNAKKIDCAGGPVNAAPPEFAEEDGSVHLNKACLFRFKYEEEGQQPIEQVGVGIVLELVPAKDDQPVSYTVQWCPPKLGRAGQDENLYKKPISATMPFFTNYKIKKQIDGQWTARAEYEVFENVELESFLAYNLELSFSGSGNNKVGKFRKNGRSFPIVESQLQSYYSNKCDDDDA